MKEINEDRSQKESEEGSYRQCLNMIAFACFAPVRMLDWLRISRLGHLIRNRETCKDERIFAANSDLHRAARMQAMMEDANLPWTLSMAFYVLSGGCAHRSKAGKIFVLQRDAIVHLSKYEPTTQLQVPQAVSEDPGKANTISKAITCVQALWFCMQCVTRISQGLAVSLLELNTFSHCISALLIYIFWWHKPYDAQSHVYVESPSLDLMAPAEVNKIYMALDQFLSEQVHMPYLKSFARFHTWIYTIFDQNGNPLLTGHNLNIDHMTESKLEIPGTKLYLASISNLTFHGDKAELAISACQKFWRAWLDMGRPVPVKPVVPAIGELV